MVVVGYQPSDWIILPELNKSMARETVGVLSQVVTNRFAGTGLDLIVSLIV